MMTTLIVEMSIRTRMKKEGEEGDDDDVPQPPAKRRK